MSQSKVRATISEAKIVWHREANGVSYNQMRQGGIFKLALSPGFISCLDGIFIPFPDCNEIDIVIDLFNH